MTNFCNMSIYVPRVDLEFTEEDVKFYFENWEIGKVSHVDFIQKMEQEYHHMYVHFDYWFNTPFTHELQRQLNNDVSVKMSYVSHSKNDDSYEFSFSWFLLKNKTKKIISGERKQTIDLGDLYPSTHNKPSNNNDTSIVATTEYVANDYVSLLLDINTKLRRQMSFITKMPYPPTPRFNGLHECELIDEMDVLNLENDNYNLYNHVQSLKNVMCVM